MLIAAANQVTIWDYFSQSFGFLVSWYAIVFFAFGESLPTSLNAWFGETNVKRIRMNIGALAFTAIFIVANHQITPS